MTQGSPPARQPLRLELPPNLQATYANAAIIAQTTSEIVLDFLQIMPGDQRARVAQRVVMTPANAKLLMQALQTNLARFEEKYGEIKVQSVGPTLADQLFGTIKPSDNPGEGEERRPNDEQP